MDMARTYPKSHFTGVDLMIYPLSAPPTNCHFRLADLSKGLPYPDNTFDMVSQHDTLFRYSQKDWDTILPEIVRVTKPGGYIELVESGGGAQDIGPNMSIWMMRRKKKSFFIVIFYINRHVSIVTVSLQTRGINLKISNSLGSMLEELEDVTDIKSSHRSSPIGWYGKTGDITLDCLERLFHAVKPKVCEDWSMSLAKYDKMVETASAECRDFRSWVNVHYVTATKVKK